MAVKKALALVIFAAAASARAEPEAFSNRIFDFDVEGLRRHAKEEGLTFEVKETWVTKFLREGGDRLRVTGLLHRKNELAGARFVDVKESEELPAAFDWRTKVEGGLQPIRNQGNCGSCWAFSVTGVVESLMRIKHPDEQHNYSEQSLVDCSPSGDCGGGYFDAFDTIKKKGLPNEADYPYTARNGRCRSSVPAAQKIASWSYIGNGRTSPTTEQIKTAIMKYGPVSVDVYAGFSSYSRGVFNRCVSARTDHMVDLVGWDDEGGYWIMRNSWGSSWGESGYMRIKYTDSRGRKCNNIGQVAAFAVLPGQEL